MFGLESLTAPGFSGKGFLAERALRSLAKPMKEMAAGIAAGTRIATAAGHRSVEAIAEGDLVLTFDSGMQPVRAVARGTLWRGPGACPEALRPLYVPPAALGNTEALFLLPEQTLLVESDTAELILGNPFAIVTAETLEGFRGIERVAPSEDLEAVQLLFDDDEVVFAATGALFLCSAAQSMSISDLVDEQVKRERYRVLSAEEAQLLVECMLEEDATPTPVLSA